MYFFLGALLEVPAYLLLWPLMAALGRMKTLSLLYLVCAAAISAVAGLQTTAAGGWLTARWSGSILKLSRNRDYLRKIF